MNTDVLVIGTGISGLSYAIKLSKLSPTTKITLICKEDLMEGNTRYAQGGIAAVYNFEKTPLKNTLKTPTSQAIPKETLMLSILLLKKVLIG